MRSWPIKDAGILPPPTLLGSAWTWQPWRVEANSRVSPIVEVSKPLMLQQGQSRTVSGRCPAKCSQKEIWKERLMSATVLHRTSWSVSSQVWQYFLQWYIQSRNWAIYLWEISHQRSSWRWAIQDWHLTKKMRSPLAAEWHWASGRPASTYPSRFCRKSDFMFREKRHLSSGKQKDEIGYCVLSGQQY